MLPCNEGPVPPCACGNLDQASGTKVSPGKFFASSPDDLYWLAGGVRQASSFNGHLAGMLANITAAPVRVDHAHLRRRQVKRLGQFIANTKIGRAHVWTPVT